MGGGRWGQTPEAPGDGTFLDNDQRPGMTVMGADHAAEAVKSQHRGLILAIIWRGRGRGSFIQNFFKRIKRLIHFLGFFPSEDDKPHVASCFVSVSEDWGGDHSYHTE